MSHSTVTNQGFIHWKRLRAKLLWQWWRYLLVASVGTAIFIHSLPPREPVMFAVLLLIPILSLRQAWKVDRQIVVCDARFKSPNEIEND